MVCKMNEDVLKSIAAEMILVSGCFFSFAVDQKKHREEICREKIPMLVSRAKSSSPSHSS